jgi:hypothetical protein
MKKYQRSHHCLKGRTIQTYSTEKQAGQIQTGSGQVSTFGSFVTGNYQAMYNNIINNSVA